MEASSILQPPSEASAVTFSTTSTGSVPASLTSAGSPRTSETPAAHPPTRLLTLYLVKATPRIWEGSVIVGGIGGREVAPGVPDCDSTSLAALASELVHQGFDARERAFSMLLCVASLPRIHCRRLTLVVLSSQACPHDRPSAARIASVALTLLPATDPYALWRGGSCNQSVAHFSARRYARARPLLPLFFEHLPRRSPAAAATAVSAVDRSRHPTPVGQPAARNRQGFAYAGPPRRPARDDRRPRYQRLGQRDGLPARKERLLAPGPAPGPAQGQARQRCVWPPPFDPGALPCWWGRHRRCGRTRYRPLVAATVSV
jgi:hypothetical protein